MKTNTKKLALCSIIIALGVILSPYSIPVGIARCYPWQHLINVISAILLGPAYAIINALAISIIRNIMGLGTLLAFPGSIFGALLASIMYKKHSKIFMAFFGEVIGTGIIGSLCAYPVALLLMGKNPAIFTYIIPFTISSFSGALVSFLLFEFTALKKLVIGRSINRQRDGGRYSQMKF